MPSSGPFGSEQARRRAITVLMAVALFGATLVAWTIVRRRTPDRPISLLDGGTAAPLAIGVKPDPDLA
ncbi:MAG: hypothetical protein ACF8PN_12840 [Phycisphaerales bacterium]